MTYKNLGKSHTFLVDASVYIFRAFFSLPASLTDTEGRPINALYGFCRFIIELLQESQPHSIAIAFDESLTTSFRNEIFPEYKANRESPPPELVWQLQLCRRFTSLMGLANFASPRYEADDIIGALTVKLRNQNQNVVVVTRDKDLMQLLKLRDYYLDYAAKKLIGYGDVKTHLGVRPEQVAQYLALTGDPVDNIPGVPGIGKKTAIALLDAFDSVEDALDQSQDIAKLSIRGAKKLADKLIEHQDTIAFAFRLTEIPQTIDLDLPLIDLKPKTRDEAGLEEFFNELGMGKQMMAAIKALP